MGRTSSRGKSKTASVAAPTAEHNDVERVDEEFEKKSAEAAKKKAEEAEKRKAKTERRKEEAEKRRAESKRRIDAEQAEMNGVDAVTICSKVEDVEKTSVDPDTTFGDAAIAETTETEAEAEMALKDSTPAIICTEAEITREESELSTPMVENPKKSASSEPDSSAAMRARILSSRASQARTAAAKKSAAGKARQASQARIRSTSARKQRRNSSSDK